jgi:predicted GNAT superfamily acetyltransferase
VRETAAWQLAREAANAAGVELRPLDRLEDSDSINEIEIATWGEEQELGTEIVRALQLSGNVPWGALEPDGTLVGYVLGFAGVDGEGLHVHSHMLATLAHRRSRGVGFALKLAQRAQALDQEIHVVRWTFDPLIARNAYFNIVKLEASCDRFERNFYGAMSDEQNRGDRSDRLTVRWDLDRAPSSAAEAAGPRESEGSLLLSAAGTADAPFPELDLSAMPAERETPVLVQIPREYQTLRDENAELARRWREAAAEAIEACLVAGRVARRFTPHPAYVFT